MSLFGPSAKDIGYELYKADLRKNKCYGTHFVIPGTYVCSICGDKPIRLKNGRYKFREYNKTT